MISQEEKERVIQATNFLSLVSETVELHERTSGDFWGRCPFHEERTESFHINTIRGVYYCFGCEAKGDVIDYVARRENLSFPDALRYLADRAGIELREVQRTQSGPQKKRLLDCLAAAQEHFSYNLLHRVDPLGKCAQARAYLGGRNLGREVSLRWGLGFSLGGQDLANYLLDQGFSKAELAACDVAQPRRRGLSDRFFDRVMFPICDEAGRTIGFGGRVMGDAKPKYLNSKDSSIWHKSKNLYGLDKAKAAITATGQIIVVEGYTDTIALHEAGFTNAVAILGTALTSDHIKLINRFRPQEILNMLDGDAAGQRAAEKTLAHVGQTKARLTCVVLPNNQDPAEFLAAKGPAALQKRLDGAQDLVLTVLERHLSQALGASPGARIEILHDICAILAPLAQEPLVLGQYLPIVTDTLDVSAQEVELGITKAARARASALARSSTHLTSSNAHPGPDQSEPLRKKEDEAYSEPLPSLEALTPQQRSRIRLERELLTLLATNPAAFAQSESRIRSLHWEDPRHGRIAKVLLELPSETSPQARIQAATRVDTYAPALLAASEFERVGSSWGQKEAAFVLDEVELGSLKGQLRRISAQLQATELKKDGAAIMELMGASATLRSSIQQLETRVRQWNSL